jgi:arsenite-transporting ATPase
VRVWLPFAERRSVDLARRGDELVVTVGSYRRILALPAVFRAATVVSASMRAGELVVGLTLDGRTVESDESDEAEEVS